MSLLAGLLCAALGGVLGPALAALSVQVPRADATFGPARWSGVMLGRPAGRARVVVVTMLAVVVLGLVGAGQGFRAELAPYLWLAASAVVLAVVDLDCHRLPNRLTFPLYGVGVVASGAIALARHDAGPFVRGLIAAAAVFAAFFVLAFAGGVGFGDTKVAGALGLFLGPLGATAVLLGILAGFLLGGLSAVALLIARRTGWRTEFAFGPALLAGTLGIVVCARTLAAAGMTLGG
ncbi:MAG: prepilin peptidase [Mycobacteriales bacterium]